MMGSQHIALRKSHRLLFLVLFACGISMATSLPQRQSSGRAPKKDSIIYLLHADELSFNQFRNPDAQILVGNVVFRHNKAYMYCDSANFFEAANSFEAFGNVKMKQGDTLSLTGDYLYYDGNQQLAIVRYNVVMKHRETTLYTDSLNYDRIYDLGYFFEGGTLEDSENVLTSDWGEYSPPTRDAVFNYNVKLVNPKFVLTTDTLYYNTRSELAHFVGPSNIDNNENHIYSESGYYDTRTEYATLLDRSVLVNPERRLTGDSLIYDKLKAEGRGFRNVVLTDVKNKTQLTGDYCYYNDSTGYSFATGRAVAKDFSQEKMDTLFLHADSLIMYTYHLRTDSVYRVMHAYHKARSYRSDIQSVSDSLVYNQKDSCLTLYHNPVIWNKGMQLFGEKILVYNNDSTISWAHVVDQAMSIEQLDSVHYNQISGKEIKAFFTDGKLARTEVTGNVCFAYYPLEKDSTMVGFNRGETTEMVFYLKDQKLQKIWAGSGTSGTMYPLPMIPADQLRLKGFAWLDYIRPLNKEDIFNWRDKHAEDQLQVQPRRQTPLMDLNKLKQKEE